MLLAGLSWHITVIESLATKEETGKDEPQIKTDYYVCVLKEQAKQDAKAVGAITREILKLYKAKNPGIKEFYLRSDQVILYPKS